MEVRWSPCRAMHHNGFSWSPSATCDCHDASIYQDCSDGLQDSCDPLLHDPGMRQPLLIATLILLGVLSPAVAAAAEDEVSIWPTVRYGWPEKLSTAPPSPRRRRRDLRRRRDTRSAFTEATARPVNGSGIRRRSRNPFPARTTRESAPARRSALRKRSPPDLRGCFSDARPASPAA